ncbi:hypothetical protein FIU85_08295 [Roseovarius sp. THAF8]|nr:hypothetical protein FIU86_15080 [Roseovarius sp. THAF9]QFT97298.1 hypothetical protein FIU85_08295 [Roseovarius sp. THAF8]
MSLIHARSVLVRNRLDWSTPHLGWLPRRVYQRFFKPQV